MSTWRSILVGVFFAMALFGPFVAGMHVGASKAAAKYCPCPKPSNQSSMHHGARP